MRKKMSKVIKNKFNIHNLPQKKSLTINDKIFQFILESWFSGKKEVIKNWVSNIEKFEYKFGTKEWADQNYNTHYACKHGCWYCYAWCEAYQRKREYCDDWGKKMTRRSNWNKCWQTRENGYIIMYPTTHDILPEIMDDCFKVIENMLNANINVLVVTKPHFEVIKKLISKFPNNKEGEPQIILRFTIGTNDDDLLAFWEPHAPKFQERLKALQLAYKKGFNTSVSMEPFFPARIQSHKSKIESFIYLVEKLLPYVDSTLWIGMMNHIPVNVQRGKILTNLQKARISSLNNFYRWENINELLYHFYLNKKIRWKESIKKMTIQKINQL